MSTSKKNRILRLGKGISMPEEAITETFGILAARGAGKSNTAAVMAEEMFAAHLPFVVIDPVGAWWGLRSNSTGTGPGIDIPLFGGKRGDVPLERTGGRLVADIVVDQRLSCIIDLTEFESEGAKRQFLVDFARRLYKRNETPLHLFLEEADDYIPQTVPKAEPGEAAALPGMLLRAWENIVRRGRARGLGMTMITQRSAAINKNVLTQAQTLIAMRTTGPQDVKAIEQWVKYNAQSVDILKALPELADGEAWIWSPQFLKTTERVKFRRRRTFDSGSTPKMAAKSKTARLADVDVAKLRDQMADTIKRAEGEDPKILKRRIADLQKELKKQPAAARPEPSARINIKQYESTIASLRGAVEKLMKFVIEINAKDFASKVGDVDQDAMQKAIKSAVAQATKLIEAKLNDRNREVADLQSEGRKIVSRIKRLVDTEEVNITVDVKHNEPFTVKPAAQDRASQFLAKRQAAAIGTNGKLGKGEAIVLTAIAQHEDGVDREQVTVLTGYKRSTRDTYIQRLVAAGMIDVGPPITATSVGVETLGPDFEPLPTGGELRDYWLQCLPAGERAVLEAVIGTYPKPLDRDAISDATTYKRSTRDTYIQRLRTRKLITISGAGVAASERLF